MYATDTRKISLIEEVLKVDDDDTLKALESVLKKAHKSGIHKKNKHSIYDFVGILTKEEAHAMKAVIEETCETIHPDDWK